MQAEGGPQKLRFTIVSYSGEDSDYPAKELLFHSPQTRGWQTPRFCKYPQEIVLKLEQPSKIHQIQILSHEYKIATKVEVYVACPSPGEDPANAPYKRLGYLSFDTNERSHHQARELKSVHVSIQAHFLRLVVNRCHVNKLNIYNQVGIIALNLIGEPVNTGPDVPPGGYLQLHPPITRNVPYYNHAAADVADLNLDIHVDTVTASKIRELARAKDAAVAQEDYDEAKRLKASIDRLKVVGQKIAQLEARKRAAVEKEDYDTAKAIKVDIDKLRAAGEAAAISSDQFVPRPARNAQEVMGRVLSTGPTSFDDMPVKGMQASQGQDGLPDQQASQVSISGARQSYDEAAMETLQQEGSYNIGGSAGRSSINGYGGGSYTNKHTAYDERPAQGKGRYTPSEEQMAAATLAGNATRSSVVIGGAAPASDVPAPDGWPPDLPSPEPVTGAVAKDAEPLEELVGDYCARAHFSRNWQLREAALTYMMNKVKEGAFTGNAAAFRALATAVKRSMKDKVASLYMASLGALQQLIDGFAASITPKDVQVACEGCLPLLLEKLGDANPRVRETSKESIMFIAGMREAGLRASTHLLVKPIKNQNAWRLILGVLGLLQDLIPVFGIGGSKAGGDGFDLAELMDFVGKAYNNSNADVRAMAVKVTKEVVDVVGPAIRKHLPKDINSKIKEQLDAVLGGGDVPSGPPPPAPTTHHPTTTKGTGGGGGARSSTTNMPHKSAGGAGGGGTSTQAQRGKSAAATKSGGGGKAAAPGGASKTAAPPRQQPPPPPPQEMPGIPDDPRPYEEELRQREATLGPSHPDVAESCSNLATLYNQKGDAPAAMPLYERALRIYEATYGPDHPEVAHTLTDLAVLHLEQGNDGVGRPLLERALIIQEKALGPDHPDVIAIKDVLNSE